jgi:hypothetical protein
MFLVRPKLKAPESLNGYLLRALKMNYFDTAMGFANDLGSDLFELYGNNFNEEALEKLAKLTGFEKNSLKVRTSSGILERYNLHPSTYIKTYTRYCPLCIEKYLYHKWIWQIPFIAMCTEHRILLNEKCPTCHRRLNISEVLKNECTKCGNNINKVSSEWFDESSIEYKSQLLIQNSIDNEGDKSSFNSLNFAQLNQVIEMSVSLLNDLTSFVGDDTKLSFKLTREKKSDEISSINNLMANVYWMFQNYPFNLFEVLDSFFSKIKPNERKRRFRKFIDQAKKENYKFLEEGTKEYLTLALIEGKVSKSIIYNYVKLGIKHPNLFLDIKDIVEEFSITAFEIKNLIANGLIVPLKGDFEKIVVYFIPNKQEIWRCLNERENLITLKESASILGVSVKFINSLISDGFLKKVTTPLIAGDCVKQDDVGNFIKKIKKKKVECLPEDAKNLHHLILQAVTNQRTRKELFIQIINGDIQFIHTNDSPTLFELWADINNQEKINRKWVERKEVFSLEESAAILHVVPKTLKKMVEQKLIFPTKVDCLNTNANFMFHILTIKSYKETYMTISQASQCFDISEREIRKWVEKDQIKNYWEGINRRILVKRVDITQMLVSLNRDNLSEVRELNK